MKKEERILHALNDVKEEYIEEVQFEETDVVEGKVDSENTEVTKKNYWVRWVALAASVALIAFVGTLYPFGGFTRTETEKPSSETESEDTLNLDIVDLEKDMGFSVVTSADGSISLNRGRELINKNPWNEESTSLSYPLYKNMAYVSAAGIPAYFSEEELLSMAEDVAEKLRTNLNDWEYSYVLEEGVEKYGEPYVIKAESDIATIEVWGNGEIKILFHEAIPLPKEYLLTDDKDIEGAEEVVNYLTGEYQELLGMEMMEPDCSVDYDLQGNRSIRYNAFAQTEAGNPLAEYCFSRIRFVGDENGNLLMILYGDARNAALYVGEGLVVTKEEARARLSEGMYYSMYSEEFAVGGEFSDENIAKVELVYMTGSVCEYFIPYYCFYVETEGGSESTACYSTFYVPALADEYLDDFTEINPIGN